MAIEGVIGYGDLTDPNAALSGEWDQDRMCTSGHCMELLLVSDSDGNLVIGLFNSSHPDFDDGTAPFVPMTFEDNAQLVLTVQHHGIFETGDDAMLEAAINAFLVETEETEVAGLSRFDSFRVSTTRDPETSELSIVFGSKLKSHDGVQLTFTPDEFRGYVDRCADGRMDVVDGLFEYEAVVDLGTKSAAMAIAGVASVHSVEVQPITTTLDERFVSVSPVSI